MRFLTFKDAGREGLAVFSPGAGFRGLRADESGYPGDLLSLLRGGRSALTMAHVHLVRASPIDLQKVDVLPPIPRPSKIFGIGLNYSSALPKDQPVPVYPTIFGRNATTLVGHNQPLIRPFLSEQLDYEGELAVIIGRPGRHIPRESSLEHVAGYSIFNDASVRDYQTKTTQWTAGKNFDATGAFGPVLVTPDELPPGGRDLMVETRLNDEVVQRASTNEMIFDVSTLISLLSDFTTLEPGDVLVTGTPAGVGMHRHPKRFLHAGDVCEVEIAHIGSLRNPVSDEIRPGPAA